MKREKENFKSLLVIILAWLMAIALLAIAWQKWSNLHF